LEISRDGTSPEQSRVMNCHVRYVEVDGIVAPHTHLTEETVFFLEGTGTAIIGRKDVKITPGTMIVVPPRTMHSTVKEGSEPLRYLAIFVGNPDL